MSSISNLLTGFDFFEKPALAMGVLQYILLEVLVSRLFRFLVDHPKTWTEDFFIHIISIPFLGGLSAWSGNAGTYDDNFFSLLLDGARGIPAVFVSQYIVSSFEEGPTLPGPFDMKDVLITAASKAITRPLAGFLYQFVFPKAIKDTWDDVDLLVTAQVEHSIIKIE